MDIRERMMNSMILLKNGCVHNGRGQVSTTDLLIDGGKIVKIGEHLEASGADVIDAAGMHVFPGFIDPLSDWGILGPGREIRGNANDNDERSDVFTPQLDVKYAFNGRGITRQQIYAFGITAVGVAPSNNNVFGGQMAAFEVHGVNPMKMLIREKVGMKASVTEAVKEAYGSRNLAPMTKMGIFAMLKEKLAAAKDYHPEEEKVERDEKLAALKQVVDKQMPLFVSCNTPAEIRSVLRAVADYDLDLVFCGGFGVDGSLQELAEKRCGLIVANPANGFNKYTRNTDYAGIAQLAKQGATVAFSAADNGFGGREDLLWSALEMQKAIHDSETVLTMLTYNAAKLLGIEQLPGSLEEGKRADLVLWSANPITSYKGAVEMTIANGEILYRKGDAMKCFL